MSSNEIESGIEIGQISPAGTNAENASTSDTMGARIREMRIKKGISLSHLAEVSGVSKGYVHELENDRAAKPSAEILYNIAISLDTTVGFLLGKRRNALAVSDGEMPLTIPVSLEQFAREDRIPEEDKRQLACVRYRNEQPKTVEYWRYLYETIKRIVRPSSHSH